MQDTVGQHIALFLLWVHVFYISVLALFSLDAKNKELTRNLLILLAVLGAFCSMYDAYIVFDLLEKNTVLDVSPNNQGYDPYNYPGKNMELGQ